MMIINTYGDLQNNLTIRGKGKPPICYNCDIKFETKIELKNHKINEHSI